jgi:hypothetical protein
MSFIQAQPVAAYDLYGAVHKGLRLAITSLLTEIGRTDPADAPALAATIAKVREQCRIGAKHLVHEAQVIHPALEARAPGAAGEFDHAHAEHEAAFAELEKLLVRIEAEPAERTALWRRLYLRFARFVAEDLAHMGDEEEVIQPLLQSLFTDAELAALEQRILASIPPDDMMVFLGMMIAAGSFSGRVALPKGVKAGAPPEAFAAILETLVRPQTPAADWDRLILAVG